MKKTFSKTLLSSDKIIYVSSDPLTLIIKNCTLKPKTPTDSVLQVQSKNLYRYTSLPSGTVLPYKEQPLTSLPHPNTKKSKIPCSNPKCEKPATLSRNKNKDYIVICKQCKHGTPNPKPLPLLNTLKNWFANTPDLPIIVFNEKPLYHNQILPEPLTR